MGCYGRYLALANELTMTLDQQSINEEALHRQLYELRREGFAQVELRKIPHLLSIASVITGADDADPRARLQSVIKEAIESFPTDDEGTALAWFGLADDTRDMDKDERDEAAAGTRYISVKSFRTHHQKRLIEGVRQALLKRYEDTGDARPQEEDLGTNTDSTQASEQIPIVYVRPHPDEVEREKAKERARTEREQSEAFSFMLWCFSILGLLVLIGLVVAAYWIFHGFESSSGPSSSIPQPGTVISAQDGSVVTNPNRSATRQLIEIPDRGTLRACNLTEAISEANCVFSEPNGETITAHKGDLLWIGRSLSETGEAPVPYMELLGRRRWANNHSAEMEVLVDWEAPHNEGRERVTNKLTFEMPGGPYGYVNLVYVPGSTELRGPSWHNFIAHLPDGIMEGGVALANLGPPVSCFECFAQYKRYVFFKVRLEGLPFKTE
jgi:hypothetical protein